MVAATLDLAAVLRLCATLALFALAVAGLVALFFAWVTGWRRLARTFPDPGGAGARALATSGVTLGTWGWNAPPLRVAFDGEGVALAPWWGLRFAFRPVRIPWASVRGVERRARMLFDVVEVRYGTHADDVIGFVAGAAADAVTRAVAVRDTGSSETIEW